MIKTLTLAQDVSAVTVAAQTAVDTKRQTPFSGSGAAAVLALHVLGITGTPTILVESSNDSTFPGSTAFPTTTVATLTPTTGTVKLSTLSMNTDRYIRTRVSVGATAGTFNAYIMGTT